ncbi:MAG: hypothetical protein ACRECJ_04290 [Limisphaerales bacterium]
MRSDETENFKPDMGGSVVLPVVGFRKKQVAVSTLAWLSVFLFLGCSKSFLIANFDTAYKPRTKKIAIAPIPNLLFQTEGYEAGTMLRKAIYDALIKRQTKYSVEIQNIDETDKKLKDASIAEGGVEIMAPAVLCSVLDVDALMMGRINKQKKRGEAAVIGPKPFGLGPIKVSEFGAEITVYDGVEGILIWQYKIIKQSAILDSPSELRDSVAITIAEKFPYRKKNK